MPKKDFYKGNSFFNDPIVKNYEQGKYFNKKTKCVEIIDKPVNKYNTEFLRRVNKLNQQFYALIMSYSMMVKLLDRHKNELYGVINNMYRIIKSQGGTIRYNKIFKKSLRKYGITRQDLLDSLEKAIKSQEDRVIRNRALLVQTMKECGFEGVIEVVETDTNKDIFSNIVDFIEEQKESRILLDDESLDTFYDEVKEMYIQYLEDIASKHNIDLYRDISDKLLNALETRREKAKQSDIEYKQKVKNTKIQNKLALLNRDNRSLQSDIESLADIAEERITGDRIRKGTACRLIKQLGKFNSPVIYYIGIIRERSIKYYSKTATNNESSSIVNAYIIDSKSELIELKEELKKKEEYANAVMDVFRLDIKYRAMNSADSVSILPDFSIRNILSMRLDAINRENIDLLFSAVRQSNGYICNTNSYKGSIVIQVNMNAKNENEQILCKNLHGFYFGSIRDTNIVMHKLGCINLLGTQVVLVNDEKIKVKPLKIDFESERLKNTLLKVQKQSGIIQGLMLGGISIEDVEYSFKEQVTERKIAKLQKRMVDKGLYLAYYVAIINDFRDNYIDTDINYAKLKNDNKMTNDICSMDLYSTKETAMKAIKKLENCKYDSILYMLNTLDIRLM